MKVLFVLEHFHPYKGGVEFLFMSLGKALLREGHEVTVVTALFDQKLPTTETHEGIRIERVKCRNRFLFSLLGVPATRRWAKWADAIHTSSYTAALPAWLGSRGLNKKLIITFHEFWGNLWYELPYLRWYERRAYSAYEKMIAKLPYDKVVAVSDATRRALSEAGVSDDKLTMIYNGVDPDEMNQFKSSLTNVKEVSLTNYILFVGRLGVSKGLDILLPAMDRHLDLSENYLRLVIPTYPDSMYNKICSLINTMSNKHKVVIEHDVARQRLYLLMNRAKYTVVPSYSEGFGFVALEAQLMGSPVVSSNLGSLPEVVASMYITMTEHSVSGLVKALHEADKGNWHEGKMPYFSIKDCVDRYIDLYRGL